VITRRRVVIAAAGVMLYPLAASAQYKSMPRIRILTGRSSHARGRGRS
jgi:hypothetical protein